MADVSPLWPVLAPTITAFATLGGVYLGFQMSSSRAFRERFAAAVATERSLLETRTGDLGDGLFQWHRDSVARLAMHSSAMSWKYPKPWQKEVEPYWESYLLGQTTIWQQFLLEGTSRDELLKRLDNLYSALS